MPMNPVLAALHSAAVLEMNMGLQKAVERAQEILDTAGAERFAEFWKLYPRKVAKDYARRAWAQVHGDRHADAIMANVRRRLASKDWDPKEHPQFIPHASTFLHQHRWLDDALTGIQRAPWELT